MTRRRRRSDYTLPVQIRYYAGARLGLNNWSRLTYAKTIPNAKRASVSRLIVEQWARAVLVDRYTGDTIATLTCTQLGISIHQGDVP